MNNAATIEQAGGWPFPRAGQIRAQCATIWLEISEEHADQLRDVVPPVWVDSGFMVGEAASHTVEGHAVLSAVAKVRGRYFLHECTRGEYAGRLVELRRALA